MQFALPPRKPSHSPPYGRSSHHSSSARRRQLKAVAVLGLVAVTFFFLVSRIFSSGSASGEVVANGQANIVIVTVLDEEKFGDKYIQRIKQNREDYAQRHGYTNFFASTSEYLPYLNGAPRSWAIVPAIRHALTLYPQASHIFHLTPHALIMNPSLSLASHILDKNRLQSLMLKDVPVVPPDSVIKTFKHLAPKDVEFIITQDSENLVPASFIIRRSDWAQYFLDAWFDPLYRSYNFAKAEAHALDHIIQWHPTMLTKLALLPQRILNAYAPDSPSSGPDSHYKDGDFLIHFAGCDLPDAKQGCEKAMDAYWTRWAQVTNNV
ncbi:hypothetical protein FQN55_004007 [Onygenales sp. PD_40]|nr:hypothetical protein FQN55_004007 [Onygenales sp. PD_40]KAK2789789.1 hypothetical protein FQN52_005915 [Onygenales sp. PD_12]KAK2797140.1 hypothetical protein FQN51_008785 [Onygenales sp. PD_10]